ncbi:glycosyltransferase [Pistricoccus aurantiacus]|uniref:glycosyltransferase n=1 Tax=Pistricoccus aurantiacus TaxID=1883414 RepID=UPI003628A2D3
MMQASAVLPTVFTSSECQTSMDNLLHLANQLANQPATPLLAPIQGRIAYVVSHGQSYASNGYAVRTQGIAQALNQHGLETLCFVRPGRPWELGMAPGNVGPESVIEGVRYIHSRWPQDQVPTNEREHLEASLARFTELFRVYRPEVVVAASDFTSALPAIIAARALALPTIKEQLYYGEAFLDEEGLSYFSRMNFAEKYKVEQACFTLADQNFYLFPEDEENKETLLDILYQVVQGTPRQQPIAKLSPKEMYQVGHTTHGSGLYALELDVDDESGGKPKGIVASFRFFDDKGKPLKDSLPGFLSSKAYPHFQYIDSSMAKGTARVAVFSVPHGIGKIEIDAVAYATTGPLTLRKVRLGKIRTEDVARWLSLKVPGLHWIKAVEEYVHKEGATSLRLALLNYKHALSQRHNDFLQINGAIQEMVELDRTWLPTLAYGDKTVPIKSTNRLTVVHLHKTAYPYENTGGAIRCLNTALSQQRIGIDPYIITPIGYPRSVGIEGAKNREMIEGIEHFRIGGNTDGLRGISLPDRTSYSAFHLAKLIKERGANVIHAASGVRGYELALQALALKRLTGLPLLYEVRSFHEHTWTPVRSDAIELEKTQLRIIKEDFCMAEADFVTTISFSMQKILIERGVPPDKIAVIPNAIDEAKYLGKTFSPMPIPALEGAEMVVGYISNMSRREGHQYLIRAIHQLREQTRRDIRGLLVGNGPERENLERLAAELGMAEVIAFPGEVDHSQINAYYKAIDLFVIPRIPDYAADWVTPLKPYEAMALERPIIVTDLPALKEVVGENEERGLVAKPADVESLVGQLQRYIDDPMMRQHKVETAREWVFAERTWSANAKRYETIYRRLMASHGISEKEALHA